jgi:hypothetical protein
MKKPKLSVRPTQEECTQLHERAGRLGYNSLSAYLIDCGLSADGVLPREQRTLESLLLHVRHLTAIIGEEKHSRRADVLSRVPDELLIEVTRRAFEALRLLNIILGRASEEETEQGEKAA